MKLALHRSLTFWSGLLVMGFVGWAWKSSIGWSHEVAFGGIKISNVECAIVVENKNSNPGFYYGSWKMLPFKSEAFPPPLLLKARGIRWSDFAATEEIQEGELTYSTLMRAREPVGPLGRLKWIVPHWLILLAFAALWLSMLFWRARRRGRAAGT